MEITKELLEKKLEIYKSAAEKYRADALANTGAAQALQALLDEMNKEVKTEDKPLP